MTFCSHNKMRKNKMFTISLAALCLALGLSAQITWSDSSGHTHAPSPYKGFQSRTIKSLSDSDIEELRQGRGWGLALPAELNGLPGPAHVLELQNELELSEIQNIFDEMRTEAIAKGETLIQAELALSQAFETRDIDQARLASLIDAAANARAELRYVHLSRHLMTPEVLTPHQTQLYMVLRGYQEDPCTSIPEGHDESMWRKHNNCS